ncbi:MAG: PQQ-binding-like beta-propeller repeat protein [Planctomycetaceae bacterium]|nr:PQQ-binding-like beta-propeller repeat protein [Planctomycetales bacterium]MCB9925939.1 PQQ-binding-like beta-propeller repeat protein [Planctomycetaceae bacterium]
MLHYFTWIVGAACLCCSSACRQNASHLPTEERHERTRDFASVGWPTLNGPDGKNVSYEQNLRWSWENDRPEELWKVKVGTGYGSPVAVPNHVIVLHRLGNDELVESFHPETGESQWQFRYPTTYSCEYDYSNGPYSTPVIDGDRVYAVGAEGQLHCLAIADGSLVWERLLQDDFQKSEQLFCVGASPIVEGELIIFNLGSVKDDAGLVAFDKANGETRWAATNYKAGYATPVAATIHGQRIVFVVTYEGLVAIESETGKVLWDYQMKSNMAMTVNATSPIVDDDCVIMSTGPGPGTVCLRVLRDGQHEEKWRIKRGLDSQYSSMILVDGHLYGFSSLLNRGTFRCVDLATGDERWQYASNLRRGQALAVDDRIVVLGEFGHLAVFDINSREPSLRSITEDSVLNPPCYSAPALANGLLYLRNEEVLLCFDLRSGVAQKTSGVDQ